MAASIVFGSNIQENRSAAQWRQGFVTRFGMASSTELPAADGQISTGVGAGEFWGWLDKTTISWMDKATLSGVIYQSRNRKKKKKKSKGGRKRKTAANNLPRVRQVIFCKDAACAEFPLSQRRMPPDMARIFALQTGGSPPPTEQGEEEHEYQDQHEEEEEVEEEHEYRNWAEIPAPALTVIFRKLGAAEVLRSAQAVCSSWWHLALDHSAPLWRCFDMRCIPDFVLFGSQHDKLAEAAVDRSNGLLEHLHLMRITDHFLAYVAGRTPALRSCSLFWSFDLSPELLLNFFSQCPLLEDLRVYSCFFSPETYGEIGRTCTHLKRLSVEGTQESDLDLDDEYEFRFHKKSLKFKDDCSEPGSSTEVDSDDPEIQPEPYSDSELSSADWLASIIADTMPQLRDLQLIRNFDLTNRGLHAILDKCLHLESLDIRCCFNVRVDDALQTKLDNIKAVLISRSSRLSYRAGK